MWGGYIMKDELHRDDKIEDLEKLKQNLSENNQQYQLILSRILRVCMKIEGNPPEKYLKYFAVITPEEIQNALAHPEILEANISNRAARVGTILFNFNDPHQAIRQLFWQKFREFSIDLVADFIKNKSTDFFLSLGFMRKIFDKLGTFFNSEIENFSSDDVKAMRTRNLDYGTIYLFSGRKKNQLYPDGGYRNETVSRPIPEGDPSKIKGWSKNFDALNTCLKDAIDNTIHGKHKIQLKDVNVTVISNVCIELNLELIAILKKLQSDANYARIYIHADQFDAYLVSGINEFAYDKAISDEIEQKLYGVTKYYVVRNPDPHNLSDGNVNALVSLRLGSVFFRSTKKNAIIDCGHPGFAFEDWRPILDKALSKLTAFPEGSENNLAFMKLLGEFCHLYINIMPYISGSAAIGEWMMYGLAKSRGIDLGAFDSTRLGWDFSAFCATSSEKYGEEFIRFFPQAVGLFEQQSKNPSSFFQQNGGQNQHQLFDPDKISSRKT